MHCIRKLYLLSFFTFFYQGYLQAQPSYNFYKLFLDKGLSDTRVNAIVQDKYGFMWFGTGNGLNRFDGYSFTNYFSDEKKGLPSNIILSLFSNSKGELWIGTTSGVVRFDFAANKFIHFDTSQKEAKVIDKTGIFDFEEDINGNMYVGGAAGLFRFTPRQNQWENLSQQYKVETRLQSIRKLKFFNNDLLFVTTNNSLPFFKINIASNLLDSIYYKTASADTCCPNMFGVEKLNEEEIITGYLSHGIARVNVNTKKHTLVPGVLGKNDSVRYNTVYDILKDHNGRIWIASYYHRLAEFLPYENKIVTFESDPYNPYGFEGGSVVCIYEDRQHNIWIGTGSRGVYRFNPENNSVRFHSQNDFLPGALQSGLVLSLLVIDSNNLLVGTEKGPSFYNYKTGKYINYKGYSSIGTDKPVENIQCGLVDKKGIVWMGSNRLGLLRYDKVQKSFRGFSRVTNPYPIFEDGMTDLLLLPDERIMQIGYGRPGIFDPKTTFYTSYRTDSSALFKLTGVVNICYDSKQHIWLVTTSGKLYEYDPFTKQLNDRSALLNSIAPPFSVYKITWHREELFVGTSKGIVRLKRNAPAELIFLKQPYAGVNDIRGLLPDGEFLWFSNNRIVGRLHLVSGKILVLGEKEGLTNVQLSSRSLTLSPRGTILIGSSRGYYEIFPDKIYETNSSPVPYLTGFRMYDKPLVTTEAISAIKKIKLRYDQNFFAFDISSFNFTDAEDIEYAYKLEGFDKDWQYIGEKRSGAYTNVPGGDYVLKFKARNVSGEWNESGQQINLHIGKPFTATWWFRILLLTLIAGIFYMLYQFRIRQINKEARLRSDYEIKLNELENSALRTQMNPHFIFNSLNTINSFINSNDRAQANLYISKFAKLVRQILDHSRQKKIILKDELEVAELYMQLEQIRFLDRFHYNIQIHDVDPAITEVPPLIIQPFVENAILHGLLPKEKDGFLKIEIMKKEKMLLCVIEDNGIGREAARQLKEKSGFIRRSHGMEITVKRIELFNKEHALNYGVTITDLKNEKGEVRGTRVEILLAYLEIF